jgi:hypothetical protein
MEILAALACIPIVTASVCNTRQQHNTHFTHYELMDKSTRESFQIPRDYVESCNNLKKANMALEKKNKKLENAKNKLFGKKAAIKRATQSILKAQEVYVLKYNEYIRESRRVKAAVDSAVTQVNKQDDHVHTMWMRNAAYNYHACFH